MTVSWIAVFIRHTPINAVKLIDEKRLYFDKGLRVCLNAWTQPIVRRREELFDYNLKDGCIAHLFVFSGLYLSFVDSKMLLFWINAMNRRENTAVANHLGFFVDHKYSRFLFVFIWFTRRKRLAHSVEFFGEEWDDAFEKGEIFFSKNSLGSIDRPHFVQ